MSSLPLLAARFLEYGRWRETAVIILRVYAAFAPMLRSDNKVHCSAATGAMFVLLV